MTPTTKSSISKTNSVLQRKFSWPIDPFTNKVINTQQKRELFSLRIRGLDDSGYVDGKKFQNDGVARLFGKKKGDSPPPLEEMVDALLESKNASVLKASLSLFPGDVIQANRFPLIRQIWTPERVSKIIFGEHENNTSVRVDAIRFLYPLLSSDMLFSLLMDQDAEVVNTTWTRMSTGPLDAFAAIHPNQIQSAILHLCSLQFFVHPGHHGPTSMDCYQSAINLCEPIGSFNEVFIEQLLFSDGAESASHFVSHLLAHGKTPISSALADKMLNRSTNFSLGRFQKNVLVLKPIHFAISNNPHFFLPMFERLIDTPTPEMAESWRQSGKFPLHEFEIQFQRFEAAWLKNYVSIPLQHNSKNRLAL